MRKTTEHPASMSDERPFNLQLQDEIDYVTLGHHMRDVRKGLDYTQAQLAEILGLKPNYYGQYETGTRHISIPRFTQFVCKTQCSADALLLGCHKDYPSVVPAPESCSEVRQELNVLLDKGDDAFYADLIVIAKILLKRQ